MTRDQKTISFIIAIVYTLIVLIGSCSHMFKQPYVDPILKNAFDEWVNQCKLRDINYKRDIAKIDSILFAPLEDGYWGQCFGDKIIINENAISPIDLFTLKLVMFHELGHCAFDYPHFEWGEDIMNSVLPQEKIIVYVHQQDNVSIPYEILACIICYSIISINIILYLFIILLNIILNNK